MEELDTQVEGTEADQSTEAAQPTEGQPPVVEETPEAQQAQAEEKERHNRYQDLIYRRKEAERAAEAARQEVDALRRQLEEKAKAAPPTFSSEPPDINDFDSVTEWQKANLAWQQRELQSLVVKAREEERQFQEAEKEKRQWSEKVQTFQTQEQQLRTTLGPEGAKAYDEAVGRLDAFLLDARGNVTPQAAPLFRALFEAGPKVAHELSQDLELAARLSQADPLTVGIEIGRLTAKVNDGGRQGRRFSTAPPPETVLAGVRTSTGPKDYASMTGTEYAEARRQEEAAQRALRMQR